MKKLAIVTGAAKGIGFAIAKYLLQQDIKVIIVDNDAQSLDQAHAQLSSLGEVQAHNLDLSHENSIKAFATTILDKEGVPHYLFNNVGVGGPMEPIWEVDSVAFNKVLNINFVSAFHLVKALLPTMLKADIEATIVNTASMASFYTAPMIGSYVVSKHAMMSFSECLYHDLKAIESKIKVAVICPGGVKTNIVDQDLKHTLSSEDKLNTLSEQSKHFLLKFTKLIKKGMSPDLVAEKIFADLAKGRFYIFTHEEMKCIVESRLNAVMQSEAPQPLEL